MKNAKFNILKVLFFTYLFIHSFFSIKAQTSGLNKEDVKVIKGIYDESLTSRDTYKLLDHLCNKIGHRLSGSIGASKAVEWTEMIMNSYRFDKIYKQDLFVPNWKRGDKEGYYYQTQILVFNHEHECWDGEDGDDYDCDINQVRHWAYLPAPPME